jgi:hypothetical protein
MFAALHIGSDTADVLSTVLWAWVTSDWELKNEANWLLKGTSVRTMILHSIVGSFLMIVIFSFGWRSRLAVYPNGDCSLGEFHRFVPFGAQVTWLQSFYKLPRLKNGLIIFGICIPVAVTFAHFRASLTNTLQALGLMRWSPCAFVCARIVEVVVGLGIGFCLMFLDYRRVLRDNITTGSS